MGEDEVVKWDRQTQILREVVKALDSVEAGLHASGPACKPETVDQVLRLRREVIQELSRMKADVD